MEKDELLSPNKEVYGEPAKLVVSKKRSFEAASAYKGILDVVLLEGNEVVILGAFGCGAFENNPEVVARAAKTVVDEYRKAFKTIEFAIYCKPNEDRNYKIFERVMKER